MDIPRDLLEIMIGIDQEGLIAPLIKMAASLMRTVVIGSIRDIEVSHEFLEICHPCLEQQMKVVAHQRISHYLHLVDVAGAAQQVQKCGTVSITGIDLLAGIASAGDMIMSILELDAKRSGHG